MRKLLTWAMALVLSGGAAAAYGAQSKVTTLTCVGLYSETDAGYISFRVGTGSWTVIKVGETIPADAEIQVSVDRDWVELTPSDNPNAVYEISGSESGTVTKNVVEILKGTPRLVAAPKASGDKPDPAFKDKLVVTRYLGRQIYTSPSGDEKDVKYGDVLVVGGKVTIIAINNTINLMNAGGKVTTVVGPLKFDVAKVLKNEKLYKYLNVPR
jgi:hypothetical protein